MLPHPRSHLRSKQFEGVHLLETKTPRYGGGGGSPIEKGFCEELSGETQPPVAYYYVATEDSGFYAEFLTPLIGGYIKRGGKRDATTQIAEFQCRSFSIWSCCSMLAGS